MSGDLGFTFRETKNGDIIIYRHNKQVTILRGNKATKAKGDLSALTDVEEQQLLARLTGNYKRGNEKNRNFPD